MLNEANLSLFDNNRRTEVFYEGLLSGLPGKEYKNVSSAFDGLKLLTDNH